MLAEIKAVYTPEILERAMQLHGLVEPQDLDGFESYVFACQKLAEPASKVILKLYHQSHRLFAQIEAELDWTEFLWRKGLRVPQTLLSVQGQRIEPVGRGFFAVVTECFSGTEVRKEQMTSAYFETLGEVYGQLHAASQEYNTRYPLGVCRPHWFDAPTLRVAQYLPETEPEVILACEDLLKTILALPKNSDIYGLVHGDLHDGNFLVSEGLIQIFDFDDCEYHWFANDIAVGLFYHMNRFSNHDLPGATTAFAIEYITHLLTSYRRFFEIPEAILEQIPLFLRLRDVLLYSLLHKVQRSGCLDSDDRASLARRRLRILTQDPGCDWPEVCRYLTRYKALGGL